MPQGVFKIPPGITGRAAAVISAINDDAADPARGVPAENVLAEKVSAEKAGQFYDSTPDPAGILIAALWKANKTEVDLFLGNELAKKCAEDKDGKFQNNFNYLQVQDYLWLRDWIQFKSLRIATIPQDDYVTNHYDTLNNAVTSLKDDMDWVSKFPGSYPSELNIANGVWDSTIRGVAEMAYANFLQNHSARENWFDLHVIMIACTYGWYKLAQKYENINQGSWFYKYWVKNYLERSYTTNLSSFLDANSKFWGSKFDKEFVGTTQNDVEKVKNKVKIVEHQGVPVGQEGRNDPKVLKDEKGNAIDKGHRWSKLLRDALRLETAMFNEALQHPPQKN